MCSAKEKGGEREWSGPKLFTWSVIQRSSLRINASSYSDEPKHVCGYWWFIRVSAIVPMLSSGSPLEKQIRTEEKRIMNGTTGTQKMCFPRKPINQQKNSICFKINDDEYDF